MLPLEITVIARPRSDPVVAQASSLCETSEIATESTGKDACATGSLPSPSGRGMG